jgi:hypothetical protein
VVAVDPAESFPASLKIQQHHEQIRHIGYIEIFEVFCCVVLVFGSTCHITEQCSIFKKVHLFRAA